MQNKTINSLYLLAILSSLLFPFIIYLHHNNINQEEKKPQFMNDIRYSIDKCEYDDGKIVVKGWAFPANGQIGKITRLFVKTGGDTYPIYKSTTKTPDVVKLFGNDKRFGMVGFYGAKRAEIKPQPFELLISIEDTDGKIHETKYNCQ